jgi:hypothetical protein
MIFQMNCLPLQDMPVHKIALMPVDKARDAKQFSFGKRIIRKSPAASTCPKLATSMRTHAALQIGALKTEMAVAGV